MAENKTLLVLRLEGPLQAWGESAKFDNRDTSSMPTKSGIVGLLGCALGYPRGSELLVQLSEALTIAVRADRAGVKAVDYQTVEGSPLMAASGKPRSGSNIIITPRAYLQDACFTVFLDMPETWQDRIIDAFRNPKWSISLGRKSCVPSSPVFRGICEYATLLDAVKHYPVAYRAEYPMVYECEEYEPVAVGLQRADELTGPNRGFGMRRVWRGAIKEVSPVVSD